MKKHFGSGIFIINSDKYATANVGLIWKFLMKTTAAALRVKAAVSKAAW